MKKKPLGIAVALCLAILGTLLLVAYVHSAKDKASAADQMVSVYVMSDKVTRSTPGADIASKVNKVNVPAGLRASNAVTDLSQLKDLYATVDLLPGEQLVTTRFAARGEAARNAVPDGLLQISVALDPERVVSGTLRAGDLAAVFLSYEPPVLEYTTHLELEKVLVTDVQFQAPPGGIGTSDFKQEGVGEAPPAGKYMITLAVTALQAEKLVHGAEHGTVWMAAMPKDAPDGGSPIITPENVYDKPKL